MPQFDTTFLFSQIFWLLFSFGILYLGIHFVVFPMFDEISTKRNDLIQTPLEKAETLIQDIKILQAQIEQKKQKQDKKNEEKLQQAYQKGLQRWQKELQRTEKMLTRSLKRKIQKMETEEKEILDNASGFIVQILKGKG